MNKYKYKNKGQENERSVYKLSYSGSTCIRAFMRLRVVVMAALFVKSPES